MKKQITFIVNPFSGTSSKEGLAELFDLHLDLNQFEYNIKLTEFAGHAIELSKEAVANGSDVVVAVGGDGSVNEVAQSLLNSEVTLGILPGGSGNGFAMHLGLGREITKAISVLNTGNISTIDTCTVNDRFFINVAGVGFDARIAYMTKLNSKRGFLPYFMTAMKESNKFRPVSLEIDIDGHIINGKYALAAVANATMFGYNFTIAPTARLDDGLLDVVLVKEASIMKYAASSYRFLNKTLDKSPVVDCYQGKHVRIKVLEDDFFHVDGEGYVSPKDLEFKLLPLSLRVMVP